MNQIAFQSHFVVDFIECQREYECVCVEKKGGEREREREL